MPSKLISFVLYLSVKTSAWTYHFNATPELLMLHTSKAIQASNYR